MGKYFRIFNGLFLMLLRKFQPKVMVEVYENQLRKLATTLGDYRGRPGYPEHWPESFADMQLVVET